MGDPVDLRRMRPQFEEPPHALTAIKHVIPTHCYMVLASYMHTYVKVAGNPFWESAMQEEYNSLLKNQTWDLVLLPSDRNFFKCMWVYRTKRETCRSTSTRKE
jgi:hypothetical protein